MIRTFQSPQVVWQSVCNRKERRHKLNVRAKAMTIYQVNYGHRYTSFEIGSSGLAEDGLRNDKMILNCDLMYGIRDDHDVKMRTYVITKRIAILCCHSMN